MFGWLRRWMRPAAAPPAPEAEAERIVREIQARYGDLSWHSLLDEAAAMGVSEAELHEIVYKKPLSARDALLPVRR